MSPILRTQEERDVAAHLIWHQDVFKENPIFLKNIDAKYHDIFADAMMECLRRELPKFQPPPSPQ